MINRYHIVQLIIVLVVAGFVVSIPAKTQAVEVIKGCCVNGPGDCVPVNKTVEENMPPPTIALLVCGGGYFEKDRICENLPQCQLDRTAPVRCCVCAGAKQCLPSSEGDVPCAVPACQNSEKECTEIEECIWWHQSKQEVEKEKPLATIIFTPNITIPGSKYFNQGEPIVVTGKTFGEYIAAIYFYFVSVAGILATVMMMYGGVLYIISTGNQQKLSEAKDIITSSLMGLLIALGSYAILLLVNPNLVKFNGIGVYEAISLPRYEREVEAQGKSAYSGRQNVSTFDKCLTAEAKANTIDRNWLKAMMLVESAGNPSVVSSAKACGLIQLLPSTASDYEPSTSCEDLKDPWVNIRIAAQHYKALLINPCPESAQYKSGKTTTCYPKLTKCKPGVHQWAVAAYNGGEKANCNSIEPQCPKQTWWECTKNKGFEETRNHVKKVTAAHDKIVASEENPAANPKFVWKDNDPSIPTCQQLSQGIVP